MWAAEPVSAPVPETEWASEPGPEPGLGSDKKECLAWSDDTTEQDYGRSRLCGWNSSWNCTNQNDSRNYLMKYYTTCCQGRLVLRLGVQPEPGLQIGEDDKSVSSASS